MRRYETASTRISPEEKRELRQLALSRGYPSLADFLKDLALSALSQGTNASTGVDSGKKLAVNVKRCPLMVFFSRMRCEKCVFRKNALADPGPPPEEDLGT